MAKEGSTIGGLMDSIGTLTSLALQYEPSGFTKNPKIRNASSIIDYVFRWLGFQFVPGYPNNGSAPRAQTELPMPGLEQEVKKKLNHPVPDLPVADDTDLVPAPGVHLTATAQPGTNGNGNGSAHTHADSSGRTLDPLSQSIAHFQQDAPTCPKCGHVAVRNGACFKCLNCGESLGCS
jgi:ribonucleoside-diphosphate reductase alpha chain